MKTLRKLLLTMAFLFTSMFMLNAIADEPLDNPPPPPGGGHWEFSWHSGQVMAPSGFISPGKRR